MTLVSLCLQVSEWPYVVPSGNQENKQEMSLFSNTSEVGPIAAGLLPPCQLVATYNATANATKGEYNSTVGSNSSTVQGCVPPSNSRSRGGRQPANKIFYMGPKIEDGGLLLSYDPMIGIQTAAILGSFLLLVMAYIIYKGKCRRKQWTSTDRLFIENYKQNLTRPWTTTRRQTYKEKAKADSVAGTLELTAKWVQSQPLDEAQKKNLCKATTCNICQELIKNPACQHQCSNGHVVPTATGLLCGHPLSPSHNEMELEKRHESPADLYMCVLHHPTAKSGYKDEVPHPKARPNTLAIKIHDDQGNNKYNKYYERSREDPVRTLVRAPPITRASTVDTSGSNFERLNSKNLARGSWSQNKVMNSESNCDATAATSPPRSRRRLAKQDRLQEESPPPRYPLPLPLKIPSTPIPLFTVPGLNPGPLLTAPTLGAPNLSPANQNTPFDDSEATSLPLLLSAKQTDQDVMRSIVTGPAFGRGRPETDKLLDDIPFMDAGSVPPSPRTATTKLWYLL